MRTSRAIKQVCEEVKELTGEKGDIVNEVVTMTLALIANDFPPPNCSTLHADILALCQPALTTGRAKAIKEMRAGW